MPRSLRSCVVYSLPVRDVIPYMMVKNAETFQHKFVSYSAQTKIHNRSVELQYRPAQPNEIIGKENRNIRRNDSYVCVILSHAIH